MHERGEGHQKKKRGRERAFPSLTFINLQVDERLLKDFRSLSIPCCFIALAIAYRSTCNNQIGNYVLLNYSFLLEH